ncbi:MAG: hypothetical protein Q8R30_00080 [bacterium]|nr:hypothetical protein [bacterium]MDZ4285853.1 hypothetical protein [Candidatus Sungbacteria bacterium]
MQENQSFTRLTSLLAVLGLSVLALFSVVSVKQAESSPSAKHTQAVSLFPFTSVDTSLFVSSIPAPTSASLLPPEPEVLAQSYIVQLIGDKNPLLERENTKQMRPASLTKILTSTIALEELEANSPVVFSSFAKATGEKESPVPEGESFVRNDAIRFAMIESANDAAVALAEAVGRKRGAFSFDDALSLFVQAANQKAKSLGMTSSHFENPTGLDNDDHYTTAQDLFRLVSYVWDRHPEIWEFSRSMDADITSMGDRAYHIEATNQLLSEFPALRGGKTGLTDLAKGALILLYPVRPDRTAVIIILGSDDRFADGRALIHWLESAFNSN